MKRMFTALIVVLLFGCIQTTSASKAKTIDKMGQSFSISVKAVFKESGYSNVYKSNTSGDYSSITTRNGITVAVTSAEEFESDIRLVVREISKEETEAYDWFSSVMKEVGTDILPFDIYFEKDGQRITLNSKIQIIITLPDGYMSPFICYVTTDSKVKALQSNIKDGKISFEAEHHCYYVLADKIKGISPQTGDNVDLLLYIALVVFTASILMYRHLKMNKG